MALGDIFRDPLGQVVHVRVGTAMAFSPMLVEVVSLRLVMTEAVWLGFISVQVEGDNLYVVNVVSDI